MPEFTPEQVKLAVEHGVAFNDYRGEWFAVIDPTIPAHPTFRRLTHQQVHDLIENCDCGGTGKVWHEPEPPRHLEPCPTCTPLRNVVRDALAVKG